MEVQAEDDTAITSHTGEAIMANFAPLIQEAAAHYNIPAGVLERQMMAESGGNPNAKSPVGALGLMQLMPATARGLGVTNPLDPRQSIMGGAKYLRDQIDKFGSLKLALAAYNAGPGAVAKYGGVPPFAETHDYVNKILGGLPSVGAAPQESSPALAASAGMGARAPTAPPQVNFRQLAMSLASQAPQPQLQQMSDTPSLTNTPTMPGGGMSAMSTEGPSEQLPAPLDVKNLGLSGVNWKQFMPQKSGAQPQTPDIPGLQQLGIRGGGIRLMAPVHGTGASIVHAAQSYLGTPYKWGGTTRQGGMDCSGFLQNAMKDAGVKIGRTTYEQVKEGQPVGLNELQPGDAVFTEPGHAGPNHVGLYIGHGMIQESPHTGTVNSIIPLKNYLGGGFVAARRYTGMLPTAKGGANRGGKR
jgi:cell wall-associated NlpC family hydrolase